MPRMITCRGCGEVRAHYAHGLCQACYTKEYRRRNPRATVKGLKMEFEGLEDRVADEWVSAVDRVLSRYGASCWREGSEVVMEFQDGQVFRERV